MPDNGRYVVKVTVAKGDLKGWKGYAHGYFNRITEPVKNPAGVKELTSIAYSCFQRAGQLSWQEAEKVAKHFNDSEGYLATIVPFEQAQKEVEAHS